jgi:hypothetical protein
MSSIAFQALQQPHSTPKDHSSCNLEIFTRPQHTLSIQPPFSQPQRSQSMASTSTDPFCANCAGAASGTTASPAGNASLSTNERLESALPSTNDYKGIAVFFAERHKANSLVCWLGIAPDAPAATHTLFPITCTTGVHISRQQCI